MVMDATQPQQPSPQSVGREFVRQYYTLLNKAPNHLHRFYNNNSSFIHGESVLVVGQKNIHSRIQQLKFRDCHAKISQVDAQATLGNGVVVQVTGELSNDGQPMRRFTQTFVLAAQSPKKYYVHNDIFRYQDLYSDEENDGESRSENDEEHDQQVAVSSNELQPQQQSLPLQSQVAGSTVVDQSQQPLVVATAAAAAGGAGVLPAQQQQQQQQSVQVGTPQQQAIYYSMPAAAGRPVPILPAPQVAAVPFAGAGGSGASGVVPPTPVSAAAVTHLNGIISHDDMLGIQQANTPTQPIVAQTNSSVVQPAAVVPVAATVIATQTPTAAVTINNAVIPQSNAPTIPGFQQTPLIQQQLLQQQQQRSLSNTSQPSLLQIQQQQQAGGATTNAADTEEHGSSNNANGNSAGAVRNAVSNTFVAENTTSTASIADDFKTIEDKYEAAKKQQQQQNEPKTYANLFKSSTSSSPSGFVNAAMQQQQQLQQQQSSNTVYQSSSTITSTTYSQSQSEPTSSMSVYSNRNSDNTSSMRLDNNVGSNSQSVPMQQRNNVTRMNKDFEQRRTSNAQQFGDNQQLFLGNIPHHATEDDLKALFARFGNVLELRILSKPSGKTVPGLRNPLNYGFITYEDPDSVHNCLSNCPLYFPENSPDRQKLNVEEKKPRIRSNDMPLRQSSMGNNNMNNSQRNNMSGGPSRSLSNSGGSMIRNNNSNMARGSSNGGGPRIGGAFNRNERSNGSNVGGPQVRGGNNNAQSGGGSYGGRR